MFTVWCWHVRSTWKRFTAEISQFVFSTSGFGWWISADFSKVCRRCSWHSLCSACGSPSSNGCISSSSQNGHNFTAVLISLEADDALYVDSPSGTCAVWYETFWDSSWRQESSGLATGLRVAPDWLWICAEPTYHPSAPAFAIQAAQSGKRLSFLLRCAAKKYGFLCWSWII